MSNLFKSLVVAACFSCLPTTTGADQTVASEINFGAILQQAELANAAYQTEADIRKFSETKNFDLSAYATIPEVEIAYFLVTDNQSKQQTIAVRGTSNVENAMVDIALKLVLDEPSNLYLHQGFAHAAQQVYTAVKPLLLKDHVINTTGHSLGGAVAVILAIYLDNDGFQNGQTTTFGQPKVTNLKGADSISHIQALRIVNARDLVPLVPLFDPLDIQNLDIFWHGGKEIVLLNDDEYAILEGVDSMLRATKFTQKALNEENLHHHRMELYIEQLEKRTDSAKQVDYENSFNLFNLFGSD